jgi:ABC-type sugar transport system ATPase subunit
MASLGRISRLGVVRRRLLDAQADRSVRDLGIDVSDTRRAVSTLSGGNQQKVVIGNWLNTEPRVLLLDEPTRGVDIHARQQIFGIVRDLSCRGIASLLVSTEIEELLEVCHRVLVLRDGRIAAVYPTAGLEVDRLFAACLEDAS